MREPLLHGELERIVVRISGFVEQQMLLFIPGISPAPAPTELLPGIYTEGFSHCWSER